MNIGIKDLISIIPDLINLFLSGFIFISVYDWLNNIKHDISVITIWSIFTSFLVKAFYSSIHCVILKDVTINDSVKILIYSVTGLCLAFVFTYLKNRKLIRKLLYHTNHKSINSDIFDDIIDYNKKTILNIYLKTSNIYYTGTFWIREEKGLDSWIVLVNYNRINKDTNKLEFDPDSFGFKTTVAINLRDVELIEISYSDGSEVWKRAIREDSIN